MAAKTRKQTEPRVSKKQKIALQKQKDEARKVMEKYMPTILVTIVLSVVLIVSAIFMKANKII